MELIMQLLQNWISFNLIIKKVELNLFKLYNTG